MRGLTKIAIAIGAIAGAAWLAGKTSIWYYRARYQSVITGVEKEVLQEFEDTKTIQPETHDRLMQAWVDRLLIDEILNGNYVQTDDPDLNDLQDWRLTTAALDKVMAFYGEHRVPESVYDPLITPVTDEEEAAEKSSDSESEASEEDTTETIQA